MILNMAYFINIFRIQSIQILIDSPTLLVNCHWLVKLWLLLQEEDIIISIELLISLLLRDTDSGDTVKNNKQINEIF